MLVLSVVIVFGLNVSHASNNLIGLKDANYATNEKYEKIVVSFTKNVGETVVKELDSPKRLVVDFLQSELVLNKRDITVDSETIKQIRFGQFTPTTARVVLDLKQDIKYEVSKDGTYYIINIPRQVEAKSEGINNNIDKLKEEDLEKTDKEKEQEQSKELETQKPQQNKGEVIDEQNNQENETNETEENLYDDFQNFDASQKVAKGRHIPNIKRKS